MIVDCPGKCGRKVIIPEPIQPVSYLCKTCWHALFTTLARTIKCAQEPHLSLIKNDHEEALVS
jgi:hypothetical protein